MSSDFKVSEFSCPAIKIEIDHSKLQHQYEPEDLSILTENPNIDTLLWIERLLTMMRFCRRDLVNKEYLFPFSDYTNHQEDLFAYCLAKALLLFGFSYEQTYNQFAGSMKKDVFRKQMANYMLRWRDIRNYTNSVCVDFIHHLSYDPDRPEIKIGSYTGSMPFSDKIWEPIRDVYDVLNNLLCRPREFIHMSYEILDYKYRESEVKYRVHYAKEKKLTFVLLCGTHQKNSKSPIYKMSLLSNFEPRIFILIRKLYGRQRVRLEIRK